MMGEMAEDPGLSLRMREFYRNALARPARAERRSVPRPQGSAEPVELFWTRVTGKLSNDKEIHLICLAYISDMGMLSPAYIPFGGIRQHQPSMMVSLDHSMW